MGCSSCRSDSCRLLFPESYIRERKKEEEKVFLLFSCVHCRFFCKFAAQMDVLGSYRIDLKNMRTDSETYRFSLDNAFFDAVEGTLVRNGNVGVTLRVSKAAGIYELRFHIEGCVTVPCDRCLDDMELRIDTESVLRAKLGDEYADEGDMVVVPFEDGTLDVAWHIYEFIVLEVPIQHVHEPGHCNTEMIKVLAQHSATIRDEADDNSGEDTGDDGGKPTDPRWDKLKEILDNN